MLYSDIYTFKRYFWSWIFACTIFYYDIYFLPEFYLILFTHSLFIVDQQDGSATPILNLNNNNITCRVVRCTTCMY